VFAFGMSGLDINAAWSTTLGTAAARLVFIPSSDMLSFRSSPSGQDCKAISHRQVCGEEENKKLSYRKYRVLSLSDCNYSRNPLNQTRID